MAAAQATRRAAGQAQPLGGRVGRAGGRRADTTGVGVLSGAQEAAAAKCAHLLKGERGRGVGTLSVSTQDLESSPTIQFTV